MFKKGDRIVFKTVDEFKATTTYNNTDICIQKILQNLTATITATITENYSENFYSVDFDSYNKNVEFFCPDFFSETRFKILNNYDSTVYKHSAVILNYNKKENELTINGCYSCSFNQNSRLEWSNEYKNGIYDNCLLLNKIIELPNRKLYLDDCPIMKSNFKLYRICDPRSHIEINKCVDNGVYEIDARNFSIGVFRETDNSFTGIRYKFGDFFIDKEFHYDIGSPHGTAKPYKYLTNYPYKIYDTGLLYEWLIKFKEG